MFLNYIILNIRFPIKSYKIYKKKKVCHKVHPRERKQSIKSDCKEACTMLDLLDKDFKSAIINMYKELKETMPKQLKFENNVSGSREH